VRHLELGVLESNPGDQQHVTVDGPIGPPPRRAPPQTPLDALADGKKL